MKDMTAVKFRLVLFVSIFLVAAATIGLFYFGYNSLKSVGQDTLKRQAEAVASEGSISKFQKMRAELDSKSDVSDKLKALRSGNTLPQFDTEKSLRTIANQLGLQVRSISFVDGGGSAATPAAGSAATTPPAGNPRAPGQTGATQGAESGSSSSWGGSRNSRISFEFAGNMSYEDFIRFLDAVETSAPKLRIESVSLPSGSSRSSINPGTLTLEMATM